MPKKATEPMDLNEKNVKKVAKTTSKKSLFKEIIKKEPVKKAKKETISKKASNKEVTLKDKSKVSSTKKSANKKLPAKTTTSKTTKKASTTKKSVNKQNIKSSDIKNNISTIEYYDLPYRYNQTVVKLLYQTPTVLFVYWDISDEDKKNYIKEFGEYFFNNTKPVLVVHNETLNYSFEIDINDFANSWYFNVKDANCKYKIELGRRPINNFVEIPNNYLYITSSNEMDAPNDHILFDKLGKTIYFKDIKTNVINTKDITSISFIKNIGKVYNIYNLYKELYKNEISEDFIDLTNPSSSNPTSTFK